MKKKMIAKMIAMIIACVQLIGCGISLSVGMPIPTAPTAPAAFSEAVATQAAEPEEITVIVNSTGKTMEYHVEDVPDDLLEAAHLVRLTSDALDFDVYAC